MADGSWGDMDNRRIVTMSIEERVEAIGGIPLFEGLTHEELVEIAARAHVLDFVEGDTVVPEGEKGLGFYMILQGDARVVRDGETVASLAAGDFFGEVALLEGTPRTATVVADSALRCVGVLRAFFREWLARYPRVAMRIIEEEGQRFPPD